MTRAMRIGGCTATVLLFVGAGAALAQPRPAPAAPVPQAQQQAVPNPLGQAAQGGPITIDADRLEVRDREKRAIFSGNVVAKRGEMTMRSTSMIVFYEGDQPAGQAQPRGATPGSQEQQIRRIEMTGPVFFCQRDQAARGDRAIYERASETLVMTGNVVLTSGQNVVTGPRLVVNIRTNQAQVERDPAQPNERVRSLIVPSEAQQPPGAAAPGAPPRPAQAQRPTQAQRPEC